jgi:hypothetical protein
MQQALIHDYYAVENLYNFFQYLNILNEKCKTRKL